jgi:hypothetical protein
MTSLARRVYAAAHRLRPDQVGPNDAGFREVALVLADHAAAETPPPPPPPRRLLCAVCIEANRQAETNHIHEAMTIVYGSMVCHEHYDLMADVMTLPNAIEKIIKDGAERRRSERREKYEELQSELYQRMKEPGQ